MAQRVVVNLVDDVDGSVADETVVFGLDGTSYEIDLTSTHAAELREVFARFAQAGRKTATGARRRRTVASSSASGPTPSQIRDWATAIGHEVSERGRISAEVRKAYDAAH